MVDPKRIKPPVPRAYPDRVVAIPPTVTVVDNSPKRPSKDKLRADFRVEEFFRVIHQHGKHVIWRKALLCPCLNETTNQADIACIECDGSGYVDVDPLPIRAHMAMFDANTKIYEKFGMWLEGTTAITVEPQYRLHHHDSIECKDSIMPFNELLKKGNRRGSRSKLPSGVDSARYRIVSVTRAMIQQGSTFVTLERQIHFDIDRNGWIKWTPRGTLSVPDGTVISLLYDFHPLYRVVSHPHVTRDDVTGLRVAKDKVVSLPLQAALKLEYLVDVNRPIPQDCIDKGLYDVPEEPECLSSG
jgi:hypothetical protein